MDHDPISEPPTARKISGKQQAGKDMEDYFGFEVSHRPHQTACIRDVAIIFDFSFFDATIQDEDEHLEDEHEISKSTIQLLNFEE